MKTLQNNAVKITAKIKLTGKRDNKTLVNECAKLKFEIDKLKNQIKEFEKPYNKNREIIISRTKDGKIETPEAIATISTVHRESIDLSELPLEVLELVKPYIKKSSSRRFAVRSK